MKVEQFMHANQFHLYGEGKDILQSYDSKVVEIDHRKRKITLGRDWDYSTTTSKHVYEFLEEYVPYGIINFAGQTSKRNYIRKLIDKGVITYDESMF